MNCVICHVLNVSFYIANGTKNEVWKYTMNVPYEIEQDLLLIEFAHST